MNQKTITLPSSQMSRGSHGSSSVHHSYHVVVCGTSARKFATIIDSRRRTWKTIVSTATTTATHCRN